ncbi:MAG: hypothetical protein AB7G80_08825 [Dongiaceae bacterium]
MASVSNHHPKSGLKTGLWLFSGGIAALALLPYMLIIAVGMIPSCLAWMFDRRPEKYAATTVLLFNGTGVLMVLLRVIEQGYNLAYSISLLQDPVVWLTLMGPAALGVILLHIIPPMVVYAMSFRAVEGIKLMEEHRQELREEWGEALGEIQVPVTQRDVAIFDSRYQ